MTVTDFPNILTWDMALEAYPNIPRDDHTAIFQAVFNSINDQKRLVWWLPRGRKFNITAPLYLPPSQDADKKVILIRSDPRESIGKKPIIKFNFSNGRDVEGTKAAMELRSNIRATDIQFVGTSSCHLIYLAPQVVIGGTTYNQDDADSSFVDCTFKNFTGYAAVIQNGRNVLIENCTFQANDSNENTVGFWHYFHDIYEDEVNSDGTVTGVDTNKPGECRKNRIFGNTFSINRGTAIRGGYMPKDWDEDYPNDDGYGDIQQLQISDNTCINCRFAHFQLEGTQTIEGISFDRNNCTTKVNLSSYIYFENGNLKSLMLTGRPEKPNKDYKGDKKVKHCLHIDQTIKTQKSRIYVDTNLKNFKEYALILGKDKDGDYSSLLILGFINTTFPDYTKKKGVAYYNKAGDLTQLTDSTANQIGDTCYG